MVKGLIITHKSKKAFKRELILGVKCSILKAILTLENKLRFFIQEVKFKS